MAAPSMHENICRKFKVNSLTNNQKTAIDGIQESRDVFVGTKTGSGKSLIYECAPELLGEDSITVIVAPLLTIMKEQTDRLQSLGFKATYIGKDSAENQEIRCGKYQFIFGSPEKLVGDLDWRDMFLTEVFKRKLKLIVVDEAHTVVQWGEDKPGETAFRKWFSKIGELRSLVCNVPILALTATASPPKRRAIMKSLVFKANALSVIDSPDRQNIKISCHMISNTASYEDIFLWLVQALQQQQGDLPKHLIFCKSIKDCSALYVLFTKKFGKNCKLFDMFHSMTPDMVKESIRLDMSSATGTIRVLICTNAAGMGVNFSALNNVVHLGPPYELDTLVQQMGRSGRDGGQAHELIIYKLHKGHLKEVESELVQLLKTTSCRRKVLCEAYLTPMPALVAHTCCDICEANCDCGEDQCPMTHPIKEMDEPLPEEDERVRTVTCDDLQLLESKLHALKCQLAVKEQVSMATDELMHGYTNPVIQQILNNISTIFSAKDVMQKAAVWSHEVAVMIVNVIGSVFGDVDASSDDSDDEY